MGADIATRFRTALTRLRALYALPVAARAMPGTRWRVTIPQHPEVFARGATEAEAIADACGQLGLDHEPEYATATPLDDGSGSVGV